MDIHCILNYISIYTTTTTTFPKRGRVPNCGPLLHTFVYSTYYYEATVKSGVLFGREFAAFPVTRQTVGGKPRPNTMQTHLYLRDYPRALALRPTVLHEAPSSVLVFEQHTTNDRAVAKLVPRPEFDNDRSWRMLGERPVFGCLGMISVMGGTSLLSRCKCFFVEHELTTSNRFTVTECFVAIVTDCRPIGKIRAGETVYKILSVQFYSLSSSKYDDVDAYNGDYGENEYDQPLVHPCAQLQKLFSVGNFYFTPDFDLTKTVQARTADASLGIHAFDDHFLWNKFLIAGLLEFRAKLERKKQSDLDRGGFLVIYNLSFCTHFSSLMLKMIRCLPFVDT